jgi:hypothetical protein
VPWLRVAVKVRQSGGIGHFGRVRQNRIMPMRERVRAERVIIGSFFHEPGERAAVTEWWSEPSIVFTSHGAWEVGARRGRGEVTPDTVLVNETAAEHDCLHPSGLEDRMLCVLFREDVDPGPALLIPHVPALHSLRRSLVAELRSAVPDIAEIDALGMAMLQVVRDFPAALGAAPRRANGPGASFSASGRRPTPGTVTLISTWSRRRGRWD